MEVTWTGLEAFWEYTVAGINKMMAIDNEHTRCVSFEMYLEHELEARANILVLEARAIRYGFG